MFWKDQRAQSMGLARFILSLIVGAFVIWIVSIMSKRILPGARNATASPEANQATTWIQQGVDFLPVAYLLIAFFGVIVTALVTRQVLRQ